MFVRSSLKSVICCHFIVFSWDAEVAHFAAREGRRLLETTDLVHLHHLIKHRESVSHSSLFYSISLCDFKGWFGHLALRNFHRVWARRKFLLFESPSSRRIRMILIVFSRVIVDGSLRLIRTQARWVGSPKRHRNRRVVHFIGRIVYVDRGSRLSDQTFYLFEVGKDTRIIWVTQLIIATSLRPLFLNSLYISCQRWTQLLDAMR